MTGYYIRAAGCDDHTEVIVDLTDAEAAAVQRVAERITATSTYSCMPRLEIRPATPEDIAELEEDA